MPTAAAPSVATQISAYLAGTGGSADRNALYVVWAGANDLFVQIDPTYAGPPGNVVSAASDLVAQVARLKAAGARYVLVPNLPDVGRTPAYLGTPGAGPATQLSQLFNQSLALGIWQAGLQVIPADVFGALTDIASNPAAYGIANATGTACVGVPSSLVCSPLNLVDPVAPATYLFADGVHPSTRGHVLLEQYFASILQGPTQISVLPETSVKNGVAMANIVYGQLMTNAWLRADAGRNAWVSVNGNWQDFETKREGKAHRDFETQFIPPLFAMRIRLALKAGKPAPDVFIEAANDLPAVMLAMAIVGGVLIVLARVTQVALYGDAPLAEHASAPGFVPCVGLPGYAGGVFLLLGTVGLYARQYDRHRIFGLASFLVAFIGISLSNDANWLYAFGSPLLDQLDPELLGLDFLNRRWGALGPAFLISYLAGGLGWLALGLHTLLAGRLPRWVGVTMIVSMALAAFTPLGSTGHQGILKNVFIAAGPFAFGTALWAELGGRENGAA